MKKYFTNISAFNFTLFDGEGAGAVGSTASGMESGGAKEVIANQTQAVAEPQTENGKSAPEDLRKQYDDFMANEDMKKFLKEDTQKVINRRFRENKAREEQLTAQLNNQNTVMEQLYARYGVDNLEKLSQAIEKDDSYWEDAAAEAGMSVEQLKNYRYMERETQRYRTMLENNHRERQIMQQQRAWLNEAQELKAVYPDFDFEAELSNPDFRGLISQKNPQYGITMRQAYELIHMNDIVDNKVKTAAQQTEKNVVDNIKARGQRPVEGAVLGQGGFITVSDISKLTRKEILEIEKKLVRGEKVSFL